MDKVTINITVYIHAIIIKRLARGVKWINIGETRSISMDAYAFI